MWQVYALVAAILIPILGYAIYLFKSTAEEKGKAERDADSLKAVDEVLRKANEADMDTTPVNSMRDRLRKRTRK